MKRLLILMLLLTGINYAAQKVYESVPKTVAESDASFTLSNANLPAYFLTCDNDFFQIYILEATAAGAGCNYALCQKSNIIGSCTTAGDTSVNPRPVTSGSTIFLGYDGKSYTASDVTSNVKWDGTWQIRRRCSKKDIIQR